MTTASETDNPSGTCIFCMQDMNSPIFVVLITYQAVISAGINCTTIPQYPMSSEDKRPSDSDDRKQNVSTRAVTYAIRNFNADEYFFSTIRRIIGINVIESLIAHNNGVVALIIAMIETTNIMNSFVRGSSFILYDSGLLEMLLHYSLAENCTDASEDKAENDKNTYSLNVDRTKEVINIFS